ncbi:AfsR/SARP family transcriptional regulator [Streptomyces luteolus]|uniref:AfsR/SARP family transcriptional regulator n=1 Tax=Streptomyces luteolus TaxID=3043615 RepID=A0ABT6SQZ7_9ACTN|nr:AfsR/SARP family transcriptional regulator [Streptomyces sp. B-S-A12]MDI3418024.1 AfsR/SARP family transcriptional regulator [Streptomyces sp. B-S-A12]
MIVNILGPLEVSDEGVCLLPSAPKTRQLLALFLLRNGAPVSVAMCLEELWGPRSPRSAIQSLHTRVLHIRQTLAASPLIGSQERAKRVLSTAHRAYVLRAEKEDFDLSRLEDNVAASRDAAAVGDDRAVSTALRAAIRLWRGPTLSDINLGPYLRARVTGLEEQRLTLTDQCIEAELRLGLHHELLAELGQLTAEYPTYENFHAQYMLALYRSGRAARALGVYHALRGRLRTELGIEPSPRLREIQTAILNADPELTVAPSHGRGLSLDMFSA